MSISAAATDAAAAAYEAPAQQTPEHIDNSGAVDEQSDAASQSPMSVGAILAGCAGVLFGAVVGRWQIKAMQRRNG